MTLRIAINGFGRIGRNVLRALYTQGYRQDLQIVAINDLGDSSINATCSNTTPCMAHSTQRSPTIRKA